MGGRAAAAASLALGGARVRSRAVELMTCYLKTGRAAPRLSLSASSHTAGSAACSSSLAFRCVLPVLHRIASLNEVVVRSTDLLHCSSD